MRKYAVTAQAVALLATLGCSAVELRDDVSLIKIAGGTAIGFNGARNCMFFLPSGFEVAITENNSRRALVAKGDEMNPDSPYVHGSVYIMEAENTPQSLVESDNLTVRNEISEYKDARILESEVSYKNRERKSYGLRVSVGTYAVALAASQKEHLPDFSELLDPCL